MIAVCLLCIQLLQVMVEHADLSDLMPLPLVQHGIGEYVITQQIVEL